MHRHEDLRLIYVLSDGIFMRTLEETAHLSAYEVLMALCTLRWRRVEKLRLPLRNFDNAVRVRMCASLTASNEKSHNFK